MANLFLTHGVILHFLIILLRVRTSPISMSRLTWKLDLYFAVKSIRIWKWVWPLTDLTSKLIILLMYKYWSQQIKNNQEKAYRKKNGRDISYNYCQDYISVLLLQLFVLLVLIIIDYQYHIPLDIKCMWYYFCESDKVKKAMSVHARLSAIFSYHGNNTGITSIGKRL